MSDPGIFEQPDLNFPPLANSLILALVVNWGLQGVLFLQVYTYYLAFPRDRLRVKLQVYGILIFECFQSAIVAHEVAVALTSSLGCFEGSKTLPELDSLHTCWFSIPVAGGITGAVGRLFFAYRIWMLSNKGWPSIFISILAIASIGAAFSSASAFSDAKSFTTILRANNGFASITAWNGIGAICDITIVLSMLYFRMRHGTGLPSAHVFTVILVPLLIRTGGLTAIMAITHLCLFVSRNPLFVIPGLAMSKIYATTMLVIFNNRGKVLGGRSYREEQGYSRTKVLVSSARLTFQSRNTPASPTLDENQPSSSPVSGDIFKKMEKGITSGSWVTRMKSTELVPKSSLQLHEQLKGMKSFWIAAEHALQHIQKNRSQIEAAFATHDIEKSKYVLYAGFDESLIQAGVGYLEQIHVFSSANIVATSPLLIQLGRIFSPFSSILFTESPIHKLPVYKPDGTTWMPDELVFHTASKFIDRGSTATMYPTVISLATDSGKSNPSGRRSSDQSESSNNQEKKGEKSKGKGKEKDETGDREKEGSNNDGSDPGEDPDDPDSLYAKSKDSIEPPTVLFNVVSLICTKDDGVEDWPFQTLTVQGEIMIQMVNHPSGSHSKCDVKFVELNFGTQRTTMNTGYEQIHLRVTVDPRERRANAKVIQPRQTSASDGEIKGISGSKSSRVHSGSIATSFKLAPQATATVGSSHTSETSEIFEKKQYTSQIDEDVLFGVVRWGFKIDDESEKRKGLKLLGSKLPEASFEFRPKFGSIDYPVSIPSYVDVEVSSYWSLISSNKPTLEWITDLLSRAQTNGVAYSNICQAVALTIPSNLIKRSDYKATLTVNVAEPGLDCDIDVEEKDGQIGGLLETSGADHYTSDEHGRWRNESLLTLPTLEHLRRTNTRRL